MVTAMGGGRRILPGSLGTEVQINSTISRLAKQGRDAKFVAALTSPDW